MSLCCELDAACMVKLTLLHPYCQKSEGRELPRGPPCGRRPNFSAEFFFNHHFTHSES